MPKRQHSYERIGDALKEYIKMQVELRGDYLRTEGRPVFMTPMSPEDRLIEFNDPIARRKVEDTLMSQYGPEAVIKYHQEIFALKEKSEEKNL